MGTGIKRWEGFRGLRTYQPVLQADLRELERVFQEVQRTLGSIIENDPIGGTTIVNTTSITNISSALADPTAQVSLVTVNGSAVTGMRSDAAPRLSVAISPTGVESWTGVHAWAPVSDNPPITINKTASLATADLLQVNDTDASFLFNIDNDGLVGVNTDPADAMVVVQGTSLGALIESHQAVYWPNDGVERGFHQATFTWPGGSSFTVDCWIKVESTADTSGFGTIAVIGEAGAGLGVATSFYHSLLGIRADAFGGGQFWYSCFNPVGGTTAFANTSPTSYKDDTWHHLAAVHEETGATSHKVSLFVDGVLIAEGSGSHANQGWALAAPQRFIGIGSSISTASTSLQGVYLAGVKYRLGRLYDTTTDGAVIGTQVFTPPLPSDILSADLEDIDMDEGAGNTLAEDVSGFEFTPHTGTFTWSLQDIDLGGGTALDLTHWVTEAGDIVARVDEQGWLGLGVDPTDPFDLLSTSIPQARWGYDSSNYLELSVSASGAVTWDAVGAGAAFTFSDAVTISGTLNAGQGIFTSTSTPQLSVRYDSSNRMDMSVSSAGLVTLDAVGASSAFVFSDAVGIGGTPANPLHVQSATTPQFKVSAVTNASTRFCTIETATAGTGATRIAPATDDTASLIQCLIRPTTALTSTGADGRATFAVQRSAGANPTVLICYGNGTIELGGSSGFAADALLTVQSAIAGKSIGFRFTPTGMTSAGATLANLSNVVTGLWAKAQPGASVSPAASVYAAAILEGPTYAGITGNVADTWPLIIRPVEGSTGNSARTFTRVGGIRIQSMAGGTNFGNFPSVYGAYIHSAFTTAPDSCTNDYGIYLEPRIHGSTINNGIFIGADPATTSIGIAFRSQSNTISTTTSDDLILDAANSVQFGVGGSAQVVFSTGLLQLGDPIDVLLGSTTGTKWGTTTGEKQAWWAATPVTQPDGSTPVHTTLDTLGLRVDAGGDPYGIVCYDNEVVCYDDVVVTI